ncbi:unnamed protein product [Adineta ricciae]|uniref:UDP-glucose/GDP-mannose dehydrogenase N-terminal domain-containing protein n=1 Tax=Adineta ricciae TaxID=249248 RepID=A0A815TBR2_ADIRI|nr:unnamed protein product [Adineta ricciae]
MKIGIIGLGKLGTPVALAISLKGHDVMGHDLDPACCQKESYPHREIGPNGEPSIEETTSDDKANSFCHSVPLRAGIYNPDHNCVNGHHFFFAAKSTVSSNFTVKKSIIPATGSVEIWVSSGTALLDFGTVFACSGRFLAPDSDRNCTGNIRSVPGHFQLEVCRKRSENEPNRPEPTVP